LSTIATGASHTRTTGLWIKICGLTTEAAVEAALAAQVNAVGFVFAASKRRVTVHHAASISRRVPSSVARVAVMLHPSQHELDEVWTVFRPDILQTDLDDLTTLRVPSELKILPVVRGVSSILQRTPPTRLLFEGPMSGTGAPSDWPAAATLACRSELILAGGLNANNVANAIATVRPFGVDVSSGVEREPGIKDPDKIASFVAAARAAAE
jgi:phosphoribosylanthranilate isomerase